MSLKRSIAWGVAAGVVIGGLVFLVACTAERQSALHLAAYALHWPVLALIDWLALTLHGSTEWGLIYMPLVPLYWILAGFIGGSVIWIIRSRGTRSNVGVTTHPKAQH
ncbi:MAG: hypothetical protein WCN95_11250 [bacterium]